MQSAQAPRFGRRLLLGGATALAGITAATPLTRTTGPGQARATEQPAPSAVVVAEDWQDFARRFITPEGRVVDSGNQGISHSEGQGTGLLFALRFGDRARFERILAWTRGTLRRPHDTLLAWRYQPGAATPVADLNNASDGDLLVAWALADAAERWSSGEWRSLAAEMARDLLRRAVLPRPEGAMLLPGAEGFLKVDHLVVNPSYFVLPAFRTLARVAPSPIWRELEAGGIALAETARFGRWRLPADWVALPRGAGRPAPAPGWPPRFSDDALRVPLNLVWAGQAQHAAVRAAVAFWTDPGHRVMPAWVDLRTGLAAPYAGDAGQEAVARLAFAASVGNRRDSALPAVADAVHYYPAAITLMARLAWQDLGLSAPLVPGCAKQAAVMSARRRDA
ncbi:glycosyl hydrolase family 5 [Roseomonas tokyonensis]|nr:glycosyl hydrolase family 5 [Falsiroseomonas tokyonensis]